MNFPWNQQTIVTRGPVVDYSNLREPLPKPPTGKVWKHDKETREWQLVPSSTEEPELVMDQIVENIPTDARERDEEWEMLSDKQLSQTSAAFIVPRAGSIRSLSSIEHEHGSSTGRAVPCSRCRQKFSGPRRLPPLIRPIMHWVQVERASWVSTISSTSSCLRTRCKESAWRTRSMSRGCGKPIAFQATRYPWRPRSLSFLCRSKHYEAGAFVYKIRTPKNTSCTHFWQNFQTSAQWKPRRKSMARSG